MPNQPKPLGAWVGPSLSVLDLCLPLLLGGEEERRHCQLPKKKKDEDAGTLPDLFGLLYLNALTCASRRLLVFPPLLRCLQMPLWFAPPKKKKKTHTRDATATPLHCRQWSNQMLFSCGALLAVHDGLRFAVRVCGRFLRSAVFLCLA